MAQISDVFFTRDGVRLHALDWGGAFFEAAAALLDRQAEGGEAQAAPNRISGG